MPEELSMRITGPLAGVVNASVIVAEEYVRAKQDIQTDAQRLCTGSTCGLVVMGAVLSFRATAREEAVSRANRRV